MYSKLSLNIIMVLMITILPNYYYCQEDGYEKLPTSDEAFHQVRMKIEPQFNIFLKRKNIFRILPPRSLEMRTVGNTNHYNVVFEAGETSCDRCQLKRIENCKIASPTTLFCNAKIIVQKSKRIYKFQQIDCKEKEKSEYDN